MYYAETKLFQVPIWQSLNCEKLESQKRTHPTVYTAKHEFSKGTYKKCLPALAWPQCTVSSKQNLCTVPLGGQWTILKCKNTMYWGLKGTVSLEKCIHFVFVKSIDFLKCFLSKYFFFSFPFWQVSSAPDTSVGSREWIYLLVFISGCSYADIICSWPSIPDRKYHIYIRYWCLRYAKVHNKCLPDAHLPHDPPSRETVSLSHIWLIIQ